MSRDTRNNLGRRSIGNSPTNPLRASLNLLVRAVRVESKLSGSLFCSVISNSRSLSLQVCSSLRRLSSISIYFNFISCSNLLYSLSSSNLLFSFSSASLISFNLLFSLSLLLVSFHSDSKISTTVGTNHARNGKSHEYLQ